MMHQDNPRLARLRHGVALTQHLAPLVLVLHRVLCMGLELGPTLALASDRASSDTKDRRRTRNLALTPSPWL